MNALQISKEQFCGRISKCKMQSQYIKNMNTRLVFKAFVSLCIVSVKLPGRLKDKSTYLKSISKNGIFWNYEQRVCSLLKSHMHGKNCLIHIFALNPITIFLCCKLHQALRPFSLLCISVLFVFFWAVRICAIVNVC